MPPIARIQQLKNAGILDKTKDLEPKAKALVDNLTDEEFHAILTVHSKISDANDQKDFGGHIRMMGF